ncbi:glycosyltransferase family 2 protein [Azohydromonas sediminis]|uniref:glycosyltransferase family 2 protein n=1 Tax=Azohydromonas sediminis TaxID=2259674 RepID=UPI000E65563C|nr:glycosyltransferase family 2 protein [Azohydromonas sediminis]
MKISVVTACYNCAATIADALASVAAQTHPAVEHVVVDGASSDGTWDVVRTWKASRLVACSERDRGIYDALNKGIARSTGDVIGFLHADDVFAGPDVLAWVAEAFADPEVDAVYGDLQYVRREDPARVVRYWRSGPFDTGLLERGWMPPHPTLYVRRALYERLGGYDVTYRIAADYEFILRLFRTPGLRAAYIPRVMVKMRTGGASNRSLRNIARKSAEDLRALRKHRIGGVHTLVWKNVSKLRQFF